MRMLDEKKEKLRIFDTLTLEAPTPQNGQTHSNNSLAKSIFHNFQGFSFGEIKSIEE